MKRLFLLVLLFFIISLSGQFSRELNTRRDLETQVGEEKQVTQQVSEKSFLEKNTEQQRDLRQNISKTLREFKSNRSKKVLFIALGIAFLYGIVHSIGPGHGKVFLVSQVLGSEVKYGAIIASSLVFAFLHSLSGLTLVAILKLMSMSLFRESAKFSIIAQNISFVILIGLGFFILLKAIFSKTEEQKHSHQGRNLFVTAIMIGFVPCPGSIIIAVYAMKMGVYSTGLLMVLAMALGMAFTLIALNSLTLFVKSMATLTLANQGNIKRISRIMTIIGSSLLILLGSLFLFTSLTS